MPRLRQADPVEVLQDRHRVAVRPKEKDKDTPMTDYLQYFARVVMANKWNGVEAGEIFVAMLGPGERVLDSLEGQWHTFEELRMLILEKDKPLRDANLTELMRLTLKEDEAIESLQNRTVTLVGKCYPMFSHDVQSQLARDHLLHALPEPVRLQVIIGKPDTLEDTVSLAKSSMLLGNSNTIATTTQKRLQNPLARKFKRADHIDRGKFHRTNDTPRDVRCYCCQGFVHYQRECPSRQVAAKVSEDVVFENAVVNNPGEGLLLRSTEQSQ